MKAKLYEYLMQYESWKHIRYIEVDKEKIEKVYEGYRLRQKADLNYKFEIEGYRTIYTVNPLLFD